MSTSIPSICQATKSKQQQQQQSKAQVIRQVSRELQNAQPYQDVLMFVLYSGHSVTLLCALIDECKKDVMGEFASEGVRSALQCFQVSKETAISMLRVIFFLMLSKDAVMRKKVCEAKISWFLPTLCPYKACNFYENLEGSVIPRWVRDETVGLMDFEELIRDSYLNA